MIPTLEPVAYVTPLPPFVIKEVAYTSKELNGVAVLVVISCISLIAVVGLLVAISVRMLHAGFVARIRHFLQLSAFNTRSSLDKHLFVRTHVAAYFICLLISNLFQAIGSIMNATWLQQSKVYTGDLCTAQGAMKQLADVSIAFWTLVIAIHTFCLLVLELHLREFVLWTTLIAGWCSIATIVVAGPATSDAAGRDHFYGISGYWCWITSEYSVQRVTLDYMFMFISATCSFFLYTVIFLKFTGRLHLDRWKVTLRWRPLTQVKDAEGDGQSVMIAKQMLLVPVAYTVVFLPIAITRLSSFSGHPASLEITIFSATMYLLSGTVNVALFASSRNILPARSMTIKKWNISLPRMLQSFERENDNIDPYYGDEHAFHRTPTEDRPKPKNEQHLGANLPNYNKDLPQISPLWIQKKDRVQSLGLTTAGGNGNDTFPGRPPTTDALRNTSGSDFEGAVIDAYDDVSLCSLDSPVIAPMKVDSSGSDYSSTSTNW